MKYIYLHIGFSCVSIFSAQMQHHQIQALSLLAFSLEGLRLSMSIQLSSQLCLSLFVYLSIFYLAVYLSVCLPDKLPVIHLHVSIHKDRQIFSGEKVCFITNPLLRVWLLSLFFRKDQVIQSLEEILKELQAFQAKREGRHERKERHLVQTSSKVIQSNLKTSPGVQTLGHSSEDCFVVELCKQEIFYFLSGKRLFVCLDTFASLFLSLYSSNAFYISIYICCVASHSASQLAVVHGNSLKNQEGCPPVDVLLVSEFHRESYRGVQTAAGVAETSKSSGKPPACSQLYSQAPSLMFVQVSILSSFAFFFKMEKHTKSCCVHPSPFK